MVHDKTFRIYKIITEKNQIEVDFIYDPDTQEPFIKEKSLWIRDLHTKEEFLLFRDKYKIEMICEQNF